MQGYDWLFMLALACVILAALVGLGVWGLDLWREIDEEDEQRRKWYQQEMRATIVMMVENPSHEEWYLHELLYEYRRDMRGLAGGTEFARVYG